MSSASSVAVRICLNVSSVFLQPKSLNREHVNLPLGNVSKRQQKPNYPKENVWTVNKQPMAFQ